ncbi:unnamed protein product [Mycena citricolor]|uniref:Uncharacterized protein n=1 Tax=Mycena citricolor TaxID=2018698 RepID=A0AAD2H1X0_9AGAR|nr:unnamed protein product [Mycena citricolor]
MISTACRYLRILSSPPAARVLLKMATSRGSRLASSATSMSKPPGCLLFLPLSSLEGLRSGAAGGSPSTRGAALALAAPAGILVVPFAGIRCCVEMSIAEVWNALNDGSRQDRNVYYLVRVVVDDLVRNIGIRHWDVSLSFFLKVDHSRFENNLHKMNACAMDRPPNLPSAPRWFRRKLVLKVTSL